MENWEGHADVPGTPGGSAQLKDVISTPSIPGVLGLPRIIDKWTLHDISCKRLIVSDF